MSIQNNLTEIWNTYSDSIIKEGKTGTRPIAGGNKKMGTKPGPGAVDLNSKQSKDIQNTGSVGNTDPNYDLEGLEEPIDPKKRVRKMFMSLKNIVQKSLMKKLKKTIGRV